MKIEGVKHMAVWKVERSWSNRADSAKEQLKPPEIRLMRNHQRERICCCVCFIRLRLAVNADVPGLN
jgi:hypothetical protein